MVVLMFVILICIFRINYQINLLLAKFTRKNIFEKSTKVERYTDDMFKLTLYCLSVTAGSLNLQRRCRYKDIHILGMSYFVLLDSTLGARQVHDTRVHQIFPTLMFSYSDREHDRQNFFSLQTIFWPFTSLATCKIKILMKLKKKNTWRYYHFIHVYHE